jgi:hypothetical protein
MLSSGEIIVGRPLKFGEETDDKLLNKSVEGITLINPIDFVRKEASYDN